MKSIEKKLENKDNQKRLITKKEILEIAIMLNNFGRKRDELNKMQVKDLRQLCQITHIIDNKPKNYHGCCFSCLKPLRADYTKHDNYCMDC